MNALEKTLFSILYFVDEPDKAVAIANYLLSNNQKKEYEIRQFLRAAGLFAKDNDGYFIRHFNPEEKEDFNIETVVRKGSTFSIFFRRPNEIRMKMAYDVLAGWVLKFLYHKHNFIPIRFNNGRGEIWHESNVGESFTDDALWEEFIAWFPEDVIAQNVKTLLDIAVKRPIGKILIPKPFEKFASIIEKAASERPSKFQKHQVKDYVEVVRKGKSASPFRINVKDNGNTIDESACFICCAGEGIKKVGIKLVLPESKKRFYDKPRTTENPSICPECFFASMISCLYPSSNYSVCEISAKDFTEVFFLSERTSNLTASLGAMQLSQALLYSVLPSRYIVVRLNNREGKLPIKTQLYLLFSNYADSFNIQFIEAFIEEAGPLERLKIHIPILKILEIFSNSVKPSSFVTNDSRKYAANEAVSYLEKGKPYTALYTLGGKALRDGNLYESKIFKSPCSFKDFDRVISEQSELLIEFLTGGIAMLKQNPKEFYEDVKELSENMFNIIKPLAQYEVENTSSNVSVVVRKYTDLIATDFPKLNLTNFRYCVAKKADDIEKKGRSYPSKGKVKSQLEGLENDIVTRFYRKYFEEGNAYLWKQFISEVNARLLSKLLLNVHSKKED